MHHKLPFSASNNKVHSCLCDWTLIMLLLWSRLCTKFHWENFVVSKPKSTYAPKGFHKLVLNKFMNRKCLKCCRERKRQRKCFTMVDCKMPQNVVRSFFINFAWVATNCQTFKVVVAKLQCIHFKLWKSMSQEIVVKESQAHSKLK